MGKIAIDSMRIDRKKYFPVINVENNLAGLMDVGLMWLFRCNIIDCEEICKLLTLEEMEFITDNNSDFAARRKLVLLIEEKFRLLKALSNQ